MIKGLRTITVQTRLAHGQGSFGTHRLLVPIFLHYFFCDSTALTELAHVEILIRNDFPSARCLMQEIFKQLLLLHVKCCDPCFSSIPDSSTVIFMMF